ncbi:MAG: peptide chain release factor N(5)-glutamine methyltransferase [Bacteroides sp.]|nr:peptide chain release factor N(5)-glutamine methyltransferase [Bacteroides sp.]
MNNTLSSIRNTLQQCYTLQEAAALSRIICCEIFGQSVTDYYLGKDMSLSSNEASKLRGILEQLTKFRPIQYIMGTARFLQRDFYVTSSVLIPRPETEELVEKLLQEVPADAHILDIGTGSGCIAVSVAKELPDAQVEAWDVSEEALAVARINSERQQVSVSFRQCDVLNYEPSQVSCYDVIVSNPPYIAQKEQTDMQRNVLDWEPSLALFVPDEDPLLFYRCIGELGQTLLVVGGRLYFEINRAYGPDVVELLLRQGYVEVRLERDLSGNDRFVMAQKGERMPQPATGQ